MKVKSVDQNHVLQLNETNIVEYTPFFYDDIQNILFLTAEFYNEINHTKCYDKLTSKFNCIVVNKLEKTYHKDNIDSSYWIIYRIYAEWYNANYWLQCLDNSYGYIELDISEIKILHLLTCHKDHNAKMNIIDESKICGDLIKKINIEINKINSSNGYFVKLSAQSPKHDFKVERQYTALDMIIYLTSSSVIQAILTRHEDCGILIRPWFDNINEHNEMRVFVFNNNVVGISQQMIYDYSIFKHYQNCADDIKNQIQNMWNQWKENKYIEYNNGVLDMWIDGCGIVHLIEINAGCNWGCTGSSLFTWKEITETHECVFACVS